MEETGMNRLLNLVVITSTFVVTGCTPKTFEISQEARHACSEHHIQCLNSCNKQHGNNIYQHEKCNNDCERHYNTCLEEVPPIVVERVAPAPAVPVIIEPYPYTGWWRGWHHHYSRHWR